MTNQEIVKCAISKAVKNGWRLKWAGDKKVKLHSTGFSEWPPTNEIYFYASRNSNIYHDNLYEVIFNHDFAKALWGVELPLTDIDAFPPLSELPAYQYHLQEMVIADDPIAYLGEHLN